MSRFRCVLPMVLAGCLGSAGCLGLAGCGDPYVSSVVSGELHLLSSVVPMERAVRDPSLTDEQRAKLDFVIQARDYAVNVVGLNAGQSYQNFANLGDKSLAWNLSASRKDAFDPYIFKVPIIGSLPYIGYFEKDQAIAARDKLVDQGYDTLIYEVDAFSTIGLLPDPVTSALLRREYWSLADTVFHELTHNTIYNYADTTFDESLATFVGRTAGLEFLASTFGDDTPMIQQAREAYEDEDRYQAFLQSLVADLNGVYNNTDLSYDEKMAKRAEIIAAAQQRFATDYLPLMHKQDVYKNYVTFPFNNAYLLVYARYNKGQDVFAAVHKLTGGDWGQTLEIFRQAAGTSDPFGFLQTFVAQ